MESLSQKIKTLLLSENYTFKLPLYSIFRDTQVKKDIFEQPFFTNKLWKVEEDLSPQKLIEEINLLKQVIVYKEAELAKKLK